MDLETKKIYAEALEMYEKGDTKKSIERLIKIINLYPNYPDVHNALGFAYSLAGNYEAAIDSFKKATELNPEYIEAYVNMAIIYNEQCQFEEAIMAFEKAASLETRIKGFSPQLKAQLANTYTQLGDTYYELQDYQKAKEEYQRAVNLGPTFIDKKLKLAKAHLQLSEYKNAEELLFDILKRNGKYLIAKTILGLCYYRQQKFVDAKKQWQEVLEIDPVNIRAKSYLNMLKEKIK